jgi:CheY-like chemotaxis protein
MSSFRLKVLVADDSATIHSIFAGIAEGSPIPFDIIRAVDGKQTIDLLNQGGFNLAFVDVNMPELSGIESVNRARDAGNKTFVTLMSTNVGESCLRLARQLKVYEFLAKPFTAGAVMDIMKTYRRVTVPTEALIVDDSATVRRIVMKVLANTIFNIDCTEAGNGEAALEHCESGAFDVVFLDCNMPGLNGLETLERMIEHDPAVKVVMMSGERNEQRRIWALDRGAFAFLQKPFYSVDVDRELHAIFGLKRPMLAATRGPGKDEAAAVA